MATRQAHERKAAERAREVIRDANVNAWPLIPETIAKQHELPVEVLAGFPNNTFGALFKKGNDFKIVLSTSCFSEGQRRFTLCHELGHYFLDGHVEVLFDGGADVHMSDTSHFRSRKHWYEVEADAFAAELLVPTSQARAVISKTGPGLRAVHAIEETFRTSLSCAAVRYANVTRDPAVIILSRGKEIEWVSWSKELQSHSWTRTRFRGDWAPPRSVTYSLAQSPDRVLGGEGDDGQGLLVEWFERAPAVTVVEEALGLGEYGRVLTVLTCERMPSPDREYADRERADARQADWRTAMRPWKWDSYEDADEE